MRTSILATGSYLPDRAVPNEALTNFPSTSLPLIEEKTGIKCRRYAAEDQCTSDLGFLAAKVCLERANVSPDEIDAILLATSTPDRIQPATATRVQELLGARQAFAFDVNSVCSGGVFAIHMADMLIRSGEARRVLVVASEVYSRFLDPKDFSTRASLGDGAGAVLLGPVEPPRGIVLTRLHSDGSGNHFIQVPAGGSMMPYSRLKNPRDAYFLMHGREVYEFATAQGEAVVNELLAASGVDRRDVAFVVPHQANITVLRALAARLGIDLSKFMINLDRYGNTAAASVLIALDELMMSGRVRTDDLVVLVVFGGGLSWGATLIRI
jgi:3-oxoacyl-[acyl-carrier-protein] synthase-3